MGGVVHLIAKAESQCLYNILCETSRDLLCNFGEVLCPARNIHVYVVQVSTTEWRARLDSP